jgi:hypothetical protein
MDGVTGLSSSALTGLLHCGLADTTGEKVEGAEEMGNAKAMLVFLAIGGEVGA